MSQLQSIYRFSRSLAAIAVSLVAAVALSALPSPASAAGPASPILSNQASASGVPAGGTIYDTATLGRGSNPTGAITFSLYGPGDPTCSASPLFTTSTAVNGNAYYSSAYYVTNAAGTYRWRASYGGDANNNPTAPNACSDPAAAVEVSKKGVGLNSSATAVPGRISNTASLAQGIGPAGPRGDITFSLFGPNNMTCAGTPVFTSVKQVSGNGSYASDAYATSVAGTYQWRVIYSGDVDNSGAMTLCSDPSNAVTVSGGGSSVTTSPTTVAPASRLTVSWSGIATPTSTDWVALYAVGAPDDAVISWKYTNGAASGSVVLRVPWETAPGSYEVRLFTNNSVARLDTSEVITVA